MEKTTKCYHLSAVAAAEYIMITVSLQSCSVMLGNIREHYEHFETGLVDVITVLVRLASMMYGSRA